MASRRNFLHLSAGLATAAMAQGCKKLFGGGEKPSFTFGPMSAEVTARTAVLWARTDAAATVHFEYGTDASLAGSARTPEVAVTAEGDFVHTAQLTGLDPAKQYFYRAVATSNDASVTGEPGQLRTAPEGPAGCLFAWSADLLASYMPFKILDMVTAAKPDVFLMLGDATYANHPKNDPAKDLAGFRRKHRDVRKSPELQRLLASTSTVGVWDDHDCTNDTDRTSPLMGPARQAFKEYWPVRAAEGAGDSLYRSFSWGPLVDTFVMDCRTFRDPKTAPNKPGKTMLGAAQKQWLKGAMKASAAPFKLLVSSIPFLAPFEDDSWFGYAAERDELKAFFANEVKGRVTILSGDFHCAWHLEDPEHRLNEIIAGPLAAWPFQEIKKPNVKAVKGSNRFYIIDAFNYGLARVEENGGKPQLVLTIHDKAGVEKYRITLGASDAAVLPPP